MANLNTTSLSDAIKTQYEKRLLMRAVTRMVYPRFAEMGTINKFGSYELRRYNGLSAVTTALTEGTTPAEQPAITITKITMTPVFYGAWIGHTDVMDMQSYDPYISQAVGVLGEQCGLSVDTLVRNTLTAGGTADYAGTAAARTDIAATSDYYMNFTDLLLQLAALTTAGALPMEGGVYPVIIHPYSWMCLMLDPVFASMFQKANEGEALRDGYVGQLLNFKFYISSNAMVHTDGGVSNADVYVATFIAKESYGCVGMSGSMPKVVDTGSDATMEPLTGKGIKPVEVIVKPVGSGDDPLNQRGTIAWKVSLDTEIMNDTWVRNYEHATPLS